MSNLSGSSWCAVLTAPGRGAIAVVAAGGPLAVAAASSQFRAVARRASPLPALGEAAFGCWGGPPGEELMVLRRDDELEVHCHGGRAAVRMIVADFVNAGCELIRWQEHLARGARDYLAAEAAEAAAAAATERTAALLLAAPASLREELATIESVAKAGDWSGADHRLETLIATYPFAARLSSGWSVAVIGPPNVGKSSLVNALLGYERAIVYDEPGVTRDVLRAPAAVAGWPIELIDAAGLRDAADPLEIEGVARARAASAAADIVLDVHDATDPLISNQLSNALENRRDNQIVVVNKTDLAPGLAVDPPALAVSAVTGSGLDELQARIAATIEPPSGAPHSFLWTDRQVLICDRALRAARNRDGSKFEQAVNDCRCGSGQPDDEGFN